MPRSFPKKTLHFYLLASLGVGRALAAESLSLENYLQEVKQKHLQYQASEKIKSHSSSQQAEAATAFSPLLGAQGSYTHNGSVGTNPLQAGESKTLTLSTSIGQYLPSGQQVKASYTLNKIDADPIPLPPPLPQLSTPPYANVLALEISNPFLKNAGAQELHLALDLAGLKDQASARGEEFKQKLLLLDAEMAYWRLALARESVLVQEEALNNQQRLRKWVLKRTTLELSDQADLLQTSVAVSSREMELKFAQDEVRAAARQFNSMRHNGSDEVREALQSINEASTQAHAGRKPGRRRDVLAAEALRDMASKAYDLAVEKYRASLDGFAALHLTGANDRLGKSTEESLSFQYPMGTIGLRFSMLTDRDLIDRHQRLALEEKDTASLQYEQKVFEEEQQWKDLSLLLADASERLSMLGKVEALQKDKLDYELRRHRLGRTTLFQVLTFENDYASTRLAKIRAQVDVLRILAQMKIYGE